MSREQYIAKLDSIVQQLNDLGVQRLVETVGFLPGCPQFVVKSANVTSLNQWKTEHNGKQKRTATGEW